MKKVKVWPVEGRLVLMPERNFAPIPVGGAVVECSSYYIRAIADGDITKTAPTPPSDTGSSSSGSTDTGSSSSGSTDDTTH